MIKVTRPPLPEVLKQHQSEWTKELMNLVKKYGSYANLPGDEKNTAVKKYQHDGIRQAIAKMFHGKCVFCESFIEASGYIHIEHFYPKSLYPECTFEWENLFSVCSRCNIAKGDHDTDTHLIVNPERDDPEKYFIYPAVRIPSTPNSPDVEKGERTIEICNLHRINLFWPLAQILGQFYENEKRLTETVSKYHSLNRKSEKISCLAKIHEALENWKYLSAETQPYAGFLRYVLRNSTVVQEAIKLVNEHLEELKLREKFELY